MKEGEDDDSPWRILGISGVPELYWLYTELDSAQRGKRDLNINIATSRPQPSKFFSVSHCRDISKPDRTSL